MLLRQKVGFAVLLLLFGFSVSMALLPRTAKDVEHSGSPRDQTQPDKPAEPAAVSERPYYDRQSDPPPVELWDKRELPTRGLHLEFLLPTHPIDRSA